MFHCNSCTCNCRQCCDVRTNTHVRIRVCVIALPKLEGKICFTVSHAPAVPSDTARLCDMCAILIQGRYYSLSRQTCVYMLLSEGLLILGICGQTWPMSTPHGRTTKRPGFITTSVGGRSIYGGPDTTAPSQGG